MHWDWTDTMWYAGWWIRLQLSFPMFIFAWGDEPQLMFSIFWWLKPQTNMEMTSIWAFHKEKHPENSSKKGIFMDFPYVPCRRWFQVTDFLHQGGFVFFFTGEGYEYFGNFGKALFTMFQVLTGESWSEALGMGCASCDMTKKWLLLLNKYRYIIYIYVYWCIYINIYIYIYMCIHIYI